MDANDKMLMECVRGEFNNQPIGERFRVADFMDYEAVSELLREREHAKASLRRIEARITTVLESIRRRRTSIGDTPAPQSKEGAGGVGACRKCGGAMMPGKALAQTFSAGSPDFPGDSVGMTMSPAGPGKLVDCMKCSACGWSVTPGVPEVRRQTESGQTPMVSGDSEANKEKG